MLLDSILVIFALLVDVDIIDIPEDHLVVSVFHGFSIAILSIFMVEISIKVYDLHLMPLHIVNSLFNKQYTMLLSSAA